MLNDTMVTLQGHVGGTVTLRQAGETNVANFRVACTPRRFQRSTDEWVDGATQWYSVSAWRHLGEHCARSLATGEPVIVHGRLSTSTYTNKDGVEVTGLEIEALLVGHDLSRGITSFSKRPSAAELQARAAAGAAAAGSGEQEAGAAGVVAA
ncbi:single-stranded DNA-binding protein [Nocardioides sp.]|jgi:single-strand DNA-binding protein|uniref:single-stranded DNA-binding protein n=1 Tax=Nocardioides sp. TaxID=35761 RepID=UPI0026364B75|nr:single-stranded DNA-binding protein [Nocardioides sp.]